MNHLLCRVTHCDKLTCFGVSVLIVTLTHLAPDHPSPPALLPYHETPDCPVAAV